MSKGDVTIAAMTAHFSHTKVITDKPQMTVRMVLTY